MKEACLKKPYRVHGDDRKHETPSQVNRTPVLSSKPRATAWMNARTRDLCCAPRSLPIVAPAPALASGPRGPHWPRERHLRHSAGRRASIREPIRTRRYQPRSPGRAGWRAAMAHGPDVRRAVPSRGQDAGGSGRSPLFGEFRSIRHPKIDRKSPNRRSSISSPSPADEAQLTERLRFSLDLEVSSQQGAHDLRAAEPFLVGDPLVLDHRRQIVDLRQDRADQLARQVARSPRSVADRLQRSRRARR
jgi:hypothetical protein